ncbi:MAG: tRNA 5-methoxyuridine(34)/uridine 5-oxyacetic acid(34) synthase CmoB [Microcoleaceae cyanobacterium]
MTNLYCPPDYLISYNTVLKTDEIISIRSLRQSRLYEPRTLKYSQAVEAIQHLQTDNFDLSDSIIKIGDRNELSTEDQQQLHQSLTTFCPWKKGPFEFFGTLIDAEWRSDWKWERILPYITPLKARKVADIGCHNGYFMFRMADQQPEIVIGFEPYGKHFWNYQLIQNIIQQNNLYFELLGVEQIDLYPNFFDTIFCLGILYHHTDPVSLLRKMYSALSSGGEIVIDCQGIPGELPIALTPRKRYANARGIWFLPTQTCLENWIARAGFQQIQCFFAEPLSIQEQRRTAWADIDSLEQFLDPNNPSLTQEGYPAPWRYYIIARKP